MKLIRAAHWLGVTAMLAIIPACESSRTQESTGEYLDSSVVTTKVKTAIADDSELSAFDIKVVSFKGKVLLSGFVDDEESIQHAERIARSVKGVKGVENNLVVK